MGYQNLIFTTPTVIIPRDTLSMLMKHLPEVAVLLPMTTSLEAGDQNPQVNLLSLFLSLSLCLSLSVSVSLSLSASSALLAHPHPSLDFTEHSQDHPTLSRLCQ
jgi:hypothetical protein